MLFVALSLEALLNYSEECQADIDAIDVCGPPFLPQANRCKIKVFIWKVKKYIFFIYNTLALLELPQTSRFSEFPAAVVQLAENIALKHSIPVLIRREHIFTFFKIDMFCLKSEFTAWEARSINNMFSLSFIRQEPYEASEYTMTLLAPNSDWNNRDVPSSSPMDILTSEEGTAYLLKVVSL